jgi:hypothetical protein
MAGNGFGMTLAVPGYPDQGDGQSGSFHTSAAFACRGEEKWHNGRTLGHLQPEIAAGQ